MTQDGPSRALWDRRSVLPYEVLYRAVAAVRPDSDGTSVGSVVMKSFDGPAVPSFNPRLPGHSPQPRTEPHAHRTAARHVALHCPLASRHNTVPTTTVLPYRPQTQSISHTTCSTTLIRRRTTSCSALSRCGPKLELCRSKGPGAGRGEIHLLLEAARPRTNG